MIPHWERGYRCHGFWLGTKRIGFIGLTPEHYKPLICFWSLDIPKQNFMTGETNNVRKAKQLVEHAYKMIHKGLL